jgi:periplasmic protein TonB
MPSSPCGPSLDRSAGHLAVRVEGRHAPEVPFLFSPANRRVGPALLVSVLAHVAAGLAALALVRAMPESAPAAGTAHRELPPGLVWLRVPGDGGGGGGGGDGSRTPAGRLLVAGSERLSVRVSQPASVPTQATEAPSPREPAPQTPIAPMGSGLESVPGSIDGLAVFSSSRGPGSGGGAGGLDGPGDGPGRGPGLGPGVGPGAGDGPPGTGGGIENPVLLVDVKPQYTPDAMKARIQGIALLECVVGEDGRTSRIRVIRSLDPVFGLDQEAIRVVERWRFSPARRRGRPVAMLVYAEVRFNLQ